MGTIAATLLLFLEEEDAFWTMSSLIEDMLPAAYYSHTLLGVQADMRVLRQLIATYLPGNTTNFFVFSVNWSACDPSVSAADSNFLEFLKKNPSCSILSFWIMKFNI
jgi:hypothetical protein